MWLFHLHSTVEIPTFSPWLDPRLRHFSGYPFEISRKKHQPFSITQPKDKGGVRSCPHPQLETPPCREPVCGCRFSALPVFSNDTCPAEENGLASALKPEIYGPAPATPLKALAASIPNMRFMFPIPKAGKFRSPNSAAACLPHSGYARIPPYPHEYMRHINKKYILYNKIKWILCTLYWYSSLDTDWHTIDEKACTGLPDRRLWMQPSPVSPPTSSVIPSRNSPTVTENPEIGALGRVVILHATI